MSTRLRLAWDSASDEEIVEHARSEGRVVVTADLDYARLLALTRVRRPRLVLFRGGNFSESEMLSMMGRVKAAVLPAMGRPERYGHQYEPGRGVQEAMRRGWKKPNEGETCF